MNLKTNLQFFFFGYGIVFFPLLLLIGPLFSELFLISVIIFFLFFIIKEKKKFFIEINFLSFFYFSTFRLYTQLYSIIII